jgi:hypothetical protein
VQYWDRVREWVGWAGSSGTPDDAAMRSSVRRGRKRLLALLILFDTLLIAATVLSFQNAELVEHEQTIEETRAVYEVLYHQQPVTVTTIITQIVPYGSIP